MPRKGDETKAIFVKTFEEQLKTQPLDKITVTTLTRTCGVNRQTFYYHFVDVHHFLQFAFRTLLDEVFAEACKQDLPQDGLAAAFKILDEKKHVVLSLTESVEYSWIRRDLLQRISDYATMRYGKHFKTETLDDHNRGFITRLYALTVFEFVEKWYTEQAYSRMDQFVESFWFVFAPYIEKSDSYAFDY